MTFRIIIFGIQFIVLLLNTSLIFSQSITYSEYIDKIKESENNEDFDGALRLLKEYFDSFPCKDFEISKKEISLNEKLQKYTDNLQIFRQGHKKGYFYFIDRRIPRYKPYIALIGFDSISAQDLELRNDAIRKSKIIYEVELPFGYSKNREWPLCLIFHGGGSNLAEVRKHWHSQKLDTDYIKIYFQSYRYYDFNSYGWTSSDERADKELEQIIRTIISEYPIDHSNIIAAGISAGGTFAIDISVRGVIPVTSFLTFCPGIPGILTGEDMPANTSPKIKGFILSGEKDYYLPQQRKITEVFSNHQYQIKHVIISSMSHEYPPNEARHIDAAIEYFERNEQ